MQFEAWKKATKERICRLRRYSRIIGILVGALLVLWVISVALFAGKDLQTAEAAKQVSDLASNIRRYYQNRPDYWGLSSQTAIEKQIAPQDMVYNGLLTNIWQKEVTIGQDSEGTMLMPGARNFTITLHDLNKDECRALASYKFNEKFWLGVQEVVLDNGEEQRIFNWDSDSNILPVKTETAKSFCSKNNSISWRCE